jgi:hypothetical protein
VARLMLRHNDGLLAVHELEQILSPQLEKRNKGAFANWPHIWDEIREKFVSRLAVRPLKAERAAEVVGFAALISRRLALDLLRREKKLVMPRQAERNEADPLERIPNAKPNPQPSDNPAVELAKGELRMQIVSFAFRAPPNPPHQSIAWAYNRFLNCGPKKMTELSGTPPKALANWPLDELRKTFLRRQEDKNFWGGATKPLREALDRPVGGVLEEPEHKRLYSHMLSLTSGDTCLRDYGTFEKRSASGLNKALNDYVLEGNLSDWTAKVNGRVRHEIVKMFFDTSADSALGGFR